VNAPDDRTQADGTAPARRGMSRWARALLLAVVIAVAVVVLFTWVFPWVEARLEDPTMGAPPTQAAPTQAPPTQALPQVARAPR
jgi:hypothetical protein